LKTIALSREDKAYHKVLPFIMFLVWPFFALLFAVVNWRAPWSKNIVWLFCGFFGFTFYIPPGGPDANRYRDWLINYNHSGTKLSEWIPVVLSGEVGKGGDFLEPIIRGLIGSYTDDYRILFCVYGLIMGYFLTRNIWFVLDRLNGKIPILSIPFLLVIIFGIGIWQINGFRFWTASHIFIFGLIQLYYFKRTKLGYGILLFAIITHITFLIPLLIVFISKLLPHNSKFLFIVIILSFIFGNIPISSVLNILPDSIFPAGQKYIKAYLLSDVAQNYIDIQGSKRWFLKLNDILAKFSFSLLCLLYLVLGTRLKKLSSQLSDLMIFAILNLALFNFLALFPSMGRFFKLSQIIICMYFVFYIAHSKHILEKYALAVIFAIPLLLNTAIQIRIGLDFIGPSPIFTSPMFAWALEALPGFKQ
jgi:hypothetical protein